MLQIKSKVEVKRWKLVISLAMKYPKMTEECIGIYKKCRAVRQQRVNQAASGLTQRRWPR